MEILVAVLTIVFFVFIFVLGINFYIETFKDKD